MTAPPNIPPFRVLVETVDADGATVLVPIATNAVVVPTEDGESVALDDGFIRVGALVLEQDERRTRLLGGGAGEDYEPSTEAPHRWVRVREDR